MKYYRNNQFIFKKVKNEVLILNPYKGILYTLKGTSKYIWQFLWKPRSLDDIVCKIISQFDVTETKAKKDILLFIKVMILNKLVKVINSESVGR